MSFDLGTLDRPFAEPGANLEASLPEGMSPAEFIELKARLHERLVKELDPGSMSGLESRRDRPPDAAAGRQGDGGGRPEPQPAPPPADRG